MPAAHDAKPSKAASVAEVRAYIDAVVEPLETVEMLPLPLALGRILARDVVSPIDVPAHDNSAMDGYAFCHDDLCKHTPDGASTDASVLRVAGTALAGRPWHGEIGHGECVRIMTGAVIPARCDTVIASERAVAMAAGNATAGLAGATLPAQSAQQNGSTGCRALHDAAPDRLTNAVSCEPAPATQTEFIGLKLDSVRRGDNRRLRGEDLAVGQLALRRGRRLAPADLGLLASLGMVEVPVQRRLRVAFFSTGDELCAIGAPLADGCIYDSNRYTVQSMLARLGCETLDLGMVGDEPAALEAAMRKACRQADVLITSGGIAAGDADHTRRIMASLADEDRHDMQFWQVAMRPGKPFAFGRLISGNDEQTREEMWQKQGPAQMPGQTCGAWLIGLPGNPVAVMISFYFLARPALLKMMGSTAGELPMVRVPTAAAIAKQPGRTQYQRGILGPDAQGRQHVQLTGAQGSGMLHSMTQANCIIVLHHDQGPVAQGDLVDIVLFEGLT